MATSEITHCLQPVNQYSHPLIFALPPHAKLIFDHCLKQGSKNNLGMFIAHRGEIAMYLGIDHDFVHDFFLTNPDLVGFDQKTHTIWIKPFYDFVDYGLRSQLRKKVKSKETGEIIEIIDRWARDRKNNFISKVLATFKKQESFQVFLKEWVEYNRELLLHVYKRYKK